MSLFTLRRRYYCPLPPTALLRQLQQLVAPRPTGWLWKLGLARPRCWGEFALATSAFTAHMPTARSKGPFIRGYWQAAPPDVAPPVGGTILWLTISAPRGELLMGGLLTCLFLSVAWSVSQAAHTVQTAIVPASMGCFCALLLVLNARFSIHRAKRYFQQALSLSEVAG